MLLRPGNAGSNTFADHKDVLAAAIGQVPARFRGKILVRIDGAGPATSSSNTCCRCPAWCRLLGLYDCDDLKDAEPDTLRYRLLSLTARLVRHTAPLRAPANTMAISSAPT